MESWVLTWTKLTQLNSQSINSIPSGTSGVYRLSYKSEDGNYYVFYIGKATDIKSRLTEHISTEEQNICIKNYKSSKNCYFRYAIITKDYIRAAAEKQMYQQYQPVCNNLLPEGSDDVKVNLS